MTEGNAEMEKGLISFVMTIYRRFEGVYETLGTLFEQDYPAIELILSDDGSEGWEAELPKLKAYIDGHKGPNIRRVRYLHEPENVGTVKNSRDAYLASSGEYIKDLAPEDLLTSPHALSRYVELLEESGCLIGFCRVEGVTEDGRIMKHLASSAENYDEMREMTPLQIRDRLFVRNCLPAPAWFAKRELFDRYGQYTDVTRLIEDYPYWIHLCTEGAKIAFWNETLIRYRLSGSGMGSYGEMFMKDMFSIYENCIFPLDRRYGVFQPVYNALKKAGLGAYMDRARWDRYSAGQKALAIIRHGPFFAYISLGEARMRRRNERDRAA